VITAGAVNEYQALFIFTEFSGVNPAGYFSAANFKLFNHNSITPAV
jgi:hypothetical protein